MTDLKQAAQMALEALRYPLDTSIKLFDADKAELMNLRAINALRRALEELPEKYTFGTPLLDLFKVSPGQIVHADAVAEPEQEPVAWMDRDGDFYRELPSPIWCPPHTPLYAHPPTPRKPLTDEEIERVCAPLGAAMLSFTEVARAIERAHGIGEQHGS